jgi:hypothetical protein
MLRSNCAGSTRMVGPSLSHGLVDISQSSMSRKFSSANFASTRVPKMCREMSTSRARSSPVLPAPSPPGISIQPDLGSISAPMRSCAAGLPFRRVCAIGALPGDFYTAMRGVALEKQGFRRARSRRRCLTQAPRMRFDHDRSGRLIFSLREGCFLPRVRRGGVPPRGVSRASQIQCRRDLLIGLAAASEFRARA